MSSVVSSYLYVGPRLCRCLRSRFLSSPLPTCFYSFLGLVNAGSVGQEKHCSSLNLHYPSTVGQGWVFSQCGSRVERPAVPLPGWCGASAAHLPKIGILLCPETPRLDPLSFWWLLAQGAQEALSLKFRSEGIGKEEGTENAVVKT